MRFELLAEVLDQHCIGHRLIEAHTHGLAHRGAHLRNRQIARSRMRVVLPVRIQARSGQVFETSFCIGDVVGEVRVQRDRVARFGHIDPALYAPGERQFARAGPALEHAPHLRQPQWRAQGEEQTDLAVGSLQLAQHIEGDHRTLAVRHHHEWPAACTQPLRQTFAHQRRTFRHEEQVMHVLQQCSGNQPQQHPVDRIDGPLGLHAAAHGRALKLVQQPMQIGTFLLALRQRVCQQVQVLFARHQAKRAQGTLHALIERRTHIARIAIARLGHWIALAIDPVRQPRTLAHGPPEQGLVPLTTQHISRRLVADAMDVDHRARLALHAGRRGLLGPGLLRTRSARPRRLLRACSSLAR